MHNVKHKVELILVSPLLRTLQTCVNIFPDAEVPVIALDLLMEYPFGGDEICNKRKDRSLLIHNFPQVNFDNIPETPIWNKNSSTIEELNEKKDLFLQFVDTLEEEHIAVVSHSSWLNYLLYNDIKTGNDLEHCRPYVYLYT